jgi:hypothetical protein
MPNTTQIPPARVPLLDPKTGLISRAWYRYLFNQYELLAQVIGVTGVVIQSPAKTTGVTLDNLSGQIVMDSNPLAASASVTFTLTNSYIAVGDTVVVTMGPGGTLDAYTVVVRSVADGSARIQVTNVSAGSLSESPVVNFAVIKAVTL